MNTVVDDILPSYHWPENAEVIVTRCGHRHVRPKGACKVGYTLDCPFCDETPQTVDAVREEPRITQV